MCSFTRHTLGTAHTLELTKRITTDRRDKMHLIFFRYDKESDEYLPTDAGQDIVPTGVVDKVLPVSVNVCRQAEKVYYKDGKLRVREGMKLLSDAEDRKSTRLNSSHVSISYAVFCLKTKTH